ncbi:MAG: glutamine synthetase family protein [Pseudomonadota bacterium]
MDAPTAAPEPANTEPMRAWLRAHPDLSSVRAAVCDMNGCFRGKRQPLNKAETTLSGQMRMPLSLSALDVWGRDTEDNPLLAKGDADGLALPTGRGPIAMPWLPRGGALVPLWMFTEDGAPSPYDPRHVLNGVLQRARVVGLTPVLGTEIEFHLMSPGTSPPQPPLSPVTGQALASDGILSLDDMDGFEAFFDDLYAAAEAAGISPDAAISEASPGQFEVTLRHRPDALAAADDAVLMKWLIRGIAQQHGCAATFMAKPYARSSGNGFHCHVSLLDRDGRNIFDNGERGGAPELSHAVAGAVEAMRDLTLIFAPHLNSYRRLRAGAHAPTVANWAYENRYAAVRIPGGPGAAHRIEHRVAGADANPYLVIAAVVSSMMSGLATARPPARDAAQTLPNRWTQAIDVFRESPMVREHFPEAFVNLYAATKTQELARFDAQIGAFEMESYLGVV